MLKPDQIAPMVWPVDWIYLKTWLSLWLQVSDDVLHVSAGLGLLVLAALALKRPPWTFRPWLVVLATEIANEAYDLVQTTYVTSEGNLAASWHDLWLTMIWPSVILLVFPRWGGTTEPDAPG